MQHIHLCAQWLGGAWERFTRWFNELALSENAILLGFAVAVGMASALGVVAFYRLIDLAFRVFYRIPGEFWPRWFFLAYRPVVTGAGFALAWWIMRRIGRGHEGMNVPDVQVAVARRGGVLPARAALARTLASVVTLGSGGSAGAEGPVAVLGSAAGSFLGRSFRFEPERVKVLVAAGAAAGISAAFNAPLTGAFFALEEILGSLATAAFPAVVVSSVVGAVISRAFFGNHPAFPIPVEYGYALLREVALFYPLLGVLVGAVSALFVRVYFAAEAWLPRLRVPRAVLPWLGGAAVGALVYLSDGRLVGFGHLALRPSVFGRLTWYALALLALGKILATAITLNAGGSGGVFTPSLYVGAATGGAFGVALATLFPALALRPEAYALVGMGAAVAAATGAPITGMLIVFEMTNDYAIMPPLMLAIVLASVTARAIEPDNLYSGWLRRRGQRLSHGSDEHLLARHRVRDACEAAPHVILEHEPASALLAHLERARATDFPVIDGEGRFRGMLSIHDLGRAAAHADTLGGVLVAADLVTESETVAPEDSLLRALRAMGARGVAALPVVDPLTGRLAGLISRADILAVYERTLAGEPGDEGSRLARSA